MLSLIHTFSVLSLQLKKLRWHNKSAIGLSNANPAAYGHKEVLKSTGHIMVTARYSDRQWSKSGQEVMQSGTWSQRNTKINGSHHHCDNALLKPTGIQIATKSLPVSISPEYRKLIGVKTMSLGTDYSFYCLECCQHFVFYNLNYELKRKTVWCAAHPTKSSKVTQNVFSAIEWLHEDKLVTTRHFAKNGAYQCQNGSSNLLTPYREQPRSTRIVVGSPRPAFSATKRTIHAPISLDNQVQVFRATRHAEIRKIEVPRSMVGGGRSWWSRRASQHPAIQSPVHPWKTHHESCPFAAPYWPSWEENRPWSDINFSLRSLLACAFGSRAQRFSTPLVRRQSNCPPPSPNLVRTHPIEQAFRDSTPCLSRATTFRRAPNWSLEEAHLVNTILNQPYRRCISTYRPNREDTQLAAYFEDESGSIPARKTFRYSYPKTRFWREKAWYVQVCK